MQRIFDSGLNAILFCLGLITSKVFVDNSAINLLVLGLVVGLAMFAIPTSELYYRRQSATPRTASVIEASHIPAAGNTAHFKARCN